MKILKVINNNVVSALDDRGREVLVSGKGIGFGKKSGQKLLPEEGQKVFVCEDEAFSSQFKNLVETTDYQTVQLAEEIIEQAKEFLGKTLNQNIYITLTDHLNYALERQRKGVVIQNALLWEIEKFYRSEYEMGLKALSIVAERTGVLLPKDEAGFLAIHLVTAEMDAKIGQAAVMPEIIQDMINIVQYSIGRKLDENSLSYERFITHLKFLLQRVVKGQVYKDLDVTMLRAMREEYKKEYECALRIKGYLKAKMKFEISEEELLYLTMHIHRAARD